MKKTTKLLVFLSTWALVISFVVVAIGINSSNSANTPTAVTSTNSSAATTTNTPSANTNSSSTSTTANTTQTNSNRCVVTVNGSQYDVTQLQYTHSGGNVFSCGTDMTATFESMHGTRWSKIARYKI